MYFRCWLVLKGKEFFDDILQNIENFVNGKYSFNIGDTWAEGLLYVTDEAYGSDDDSIRDIVYETYPEYHYDSTSNPNCKGIQAGKDLQKLYPKLIKEIMPIR